MYPSIPPPEQKGHRKRARAAATQVRRATQANLTRTLSKPPSTNAEAAARWDLFYSTKAALFKDRHLLRAAFPELMGPTAAANPSHHVPPLQPLVGHAARHPNADLTLVEAGCGVGNALFPVLRANSRLFAYAFDYSPIAIGKLLEHPEYRTDRVCAFQADVCVEDNFVTRILEETGGGVHFVTLCWTLSGVGGLSERESAVRGVGKLLKKGGMVFVRDYAVGDLRMDKFKQAGREVGERLFLRGDGTYAYFFSREEVMGLFAGAGLQCVECEYVEREVVNRREGSVMRRRWVVGKFIKN